MSTTNVSVHVIITDSPQPPPWARAVAVVLTVVVVAWVLGWLWWLVAAVAVYVAARLGHQCYQRAEVAQDFERQRCAEIAARADQQHAWVLTGDDRGVYGEFPPASAHASVDCSHAATP